MSSKAAVARVVLIVSALFGLLSHAALGLFRPPTRARASAVTASPSELEPRAYLPFVSHVAELPEPPPTIFDYDGTTERDWAWLEEEFGNVVLDRGSRAASVSVLRAIKDDSTLVARVVDAQGAPRPGVPVVFYWPGADPLQPEEYACGLTRGLVIYTKENGEAGFGMGSGAWYAPPDGGPHTVWVAVDGTDCLWGMGMLFGTNHDHLNSVWTVP